VDQITQEEEAKYKKRVQKERPVTQPTNNSEVATGSVPTTNESSIASTVVNPTTTNTQNNVQSEAEHSIETAKKDLQTQIEPNQDQKQEKEIEKEKQPEKENDSEEAQMKKAAAEELGKQVFELMDVEHNGDLTWREFEKGLSMVDLDWTQIFKDITTKKQILEKKIGRNQPKNSTRSICIDQ